MGRERTWRRVSRGRGGEGGREALYLCESEWGAGWACVEAEGGAGRTSRGLVLSADRWGR
jgi:hypothetical protein